ncbi:hypothetical protein [Longitalea arenae]|uniref:hypothetical protein n=1 Tax=Longitalea arenae TaxID=2812558 RepID=UPI0019684AED|nr:hypothetical protein [Longitalea arenae]
MKRVMCWLLPAILMAISCKKAAEQNSCITCDSRKTAKIANTLPVQVNSFRGIRSDDPNGTAPIDNPDRGLRLYYSMYASNMNQPFWSPNVNYWNNIWMLTNQFTEIIRYA